eukprot:CAMPEP_0198296672 /NCGR_PEP_ID=MMETSP1449-20131203/33421_1 /TAXON_ID=420275 /ORGANISM="Attheya septentrionalis, Strain CCMP2084" /LENGTH=328 /DNA_ID=CAMNT_0043997347 /DNA_START=36 /DNA_END=1022 /DNA_ORIENTATION=+
MKEGSSFSLSLVVTIAVAVAASLGCVTAWDMDKRCWTLLCRSATKEQFDDLSNRFERWSGDACDCTAPGNKCSRNNRNLRHHNTSEPVLQEEEEEEEEFWTDMGLNEYDPEQVEERMLEEEEEEDAAQFRGEEKQPNKELEALLGMKFNLRLWWYPFACWQMETRQREWCVNKEDGADKVAVEKCDRGGQDDWEFERIPGNRGFVQIRKYSRSGRTEPQCWEAHDRSSTKETRFSISLKTCDSNKTAQHWKIDFDSDIKYKKHHPQDEVKFEIQARNSFMMKEPCCVSQGHHPKADERMDCQTCSKPRSLKHQSSFWEAIRIKEADRV